MTFSTPQALWLLTLAVPVTLAHFYRGRRIRVAVPSLMFWDAALVEEIRSSALRRLAHHLSLALVLITLGLLAFTLAGPDIDAWRPPPRKFVMIVDTGPELRAGRRLEVAVTRARELIARMGRRDEATLLDRSGVVEPMTGDRKRLQAALRQLPRELPLCDRDDLLAMAGHLADPDSVYVFSASPGPRVVPVGEPLDNLAVGAPALIAGPSPMIKASVVSRARSRMRADLVLRDRGEILGQKSVELEPGGSATVEWPVEVARVEAGLRAECSIETPDGYSGDDRSALVTPSSLAPLVSLVTGADLDPHLMQALALLAREKAIRFRRAPSVAEVPASASVRIFDGIEPPPGTPGGVMILGAAGGRVVETPRVMDWVRDMPFHQDVDYSDVKVRRAHLVGGLALSGVEGEALILSDHGPIASWSSRMGSAVLRFGFRFRVEEGDIALRPVFPILLRRAIEWLGGDGTRAFPFAVQGGRLLVNRRPLSISEGSARVTSIRGQAVETRSWPVHEGKVRIDLPAAALLKIESGADVEWVAVHDPAAGIDLSATPTDPGPPLPAAIPWWRDLPLFTLAAAAALLVMLIEWWIYSRPA